MTFRTKLGILRRQVQVRTARRRIGVHYWLTGNPYSGMLYRQFTGALTPQPMTMLPELDAFTKLPSKGRVLWIHSEASYSWGLSGAALEHAFRAYLHSLERWSGKGGKLVWTIHDDGLHLNDRDPARIQAIRRHLVGMADLVHVHSNAAKAVVVEKFGLAASLVAVIPHPSYAPLYAENDAPDGSGKRRLLCFGNIKPYKNYGAIADALDHLETGSFACLTIAGSSSGDVELPLARYRNKVDTDLQLRFIAEDEVARLFADAHFLLLPYIESLTSGAAALSMGFGIPVIAPDLGGMREAVPAQNWPFIYQPDDSHGLVNALRHARDISAADYRSLAEACRVFGASIHPDRISRQLIDVLATRRLLEI